MRQAPTLTGPGFGQDLAQLAAGTDPIPCQNGPALGLIWPYSGTEPGKIRARWILVWFAAEEDLPIQDITRPCKAETGQSRPDCRGGQDLTGPWKSPALAVGSCRSSSCSVTRLLRTSLGGNASAERLDGCHQAVLDIIQCNPLSSAIALLSPYLALAALVAPAALALPRSSSTCSSIIPSS